MAEAARRAAGRPLLKLKLGGDGDPERLRAVRAAAPGARLVVDANEAWNAANFAANMRACAEAGVELIEQPLPAGADDMLRDVAARRAGLRRRERARRRPTSTRSPASTTPST